MTFQRFNNTANPASGAKLCQEMNVVGLAVDLVNRDAYGRRGPGHCVKNAPKSMTDKYFVAKLGDEYKVVCEQKDTMIVSAKVAVPAHVYPALETLKKKASKEVRKMLADRDKKSTKFYKSIPSVVVKSLVAKYQKNKKCKSVRNVVIPICGDKGRQVKRVGDSVRVYAVLKNELIEFKPGRRVVGDILNVEFFKKKKRWYLTVQYRTPKPLEYKFRNVVGVDRNARGNVAVTTDGTKVKVIGPDAGGIAYNYRRRRAKLQKKGKTNALKKISLKQDRRTKDINHKVSRQIVDFAKETSSAIALEDLGTISSGKAGKYVKKSQWAYHQLATFVCYKAALHGIPVLFVNPRNTSKTCSKCGKINNVRGKAYKCECGYFGHRDVNAAFNIRSRCSDAIFNVDSERPIGGPRPRCIKQETTNVRT